MKKINIMDITLASITKTYQESGQARPIFTDLNAIFPTGAFSVIVGKSGVGKSTLLNLIGGIDLPDPGKGEIRIGSTVLSSLDDRRRTLFRREHIGMVFQFFNLIPVLTVMENIALVAELDGVTRGEYEERALFLLARVGLHGRQDTFPDKLSGGEQQRVAIVRALLNNPDIILADEPTGNLDVETGIAILELIVEMTQEAGKSLLMVTHSPEAMSFASHVFTVENRQVIQQEKRG